MSAVIPDPTTTDWVPMWSLGGPGSLVFIEEKVLSAAAASVSFQNIPQTYAHLMLVVHARGDSVANFINVYLRFNGDAGANYDVVRFYVAAGTPGGSESFGGTSMLGPVVSAASAVASAFGGFYVLFPNYASVVAQKQAIMTGGGKATNAAGGLQWENDAGFWRSTAAINRIDVLTPGGNFVVGSRFSLYGLTDWYPAGQALSPPWYGTSPPSSPVDGQEWIFPVDSAGTLWRFRYNAASASAYKWEFVGGAPIIAEIATAEGTNSTSYVNLTTAGPSVVVPRAGDYVVELGCKTTGNAVSTAVMSYDIGGTAAIDADSLGVPHIVSGFAHGSRPRVKTLTAVTLTAKYKAGAGTDTFSDRWFRLIPVRMS